MQFEYDSVKSEANLAKHGIDFEAAQALWKDTSRYEIPSNGGPEERWLMIGQIESRHWTAVFTVRGEINRLISVRRSRANEVNDYGSQQDN